MNYLRKLTDTGDIIFQLLIPVLYSTFDQIIPTIDIRIRMSFGST